MPIRFKCPGCKKTLSVKEHLAGRKANCPACKKPIVIPAPLSQPADVDDLAAQVLSDPPVKKEAKPALASRPIKFTCGFCDAEVEMPFAEAGKKLPCPECRRIIRVPVPEEDKPKDWRDIIKKGPSGARINQPDQPDDVISSAQKRNVSQTALLEAGVIEEPNFDRPIGVGGWLKRGFWTATVLGLTILAYAGLSNAMRETNQEISVKKALAMIDTKGNQPPQVVLGPAWAAAVHRAAGELYCRDKKAEKAREQFRIALAKLEQRQPLNEVKEGALDKDPFPIDHDLFLIDLTLAQFELGGSDEEGFDKEKLSWSATNGELLKTLSAIKAGEARVLALRILGTRLLEKKQEAVAISLAGQLQAETPLLKAQQVALLLARRDDKQANKLLPEPTDLAKGIENPLARLAYVEGYVRQGKFDEALRLAQAKGLPLNQLEASLGAAMICLDAKPPNAAEAQKFIDHALTIAKDKAVNYQLPPWFFFQLVQTACRLDPTKIEEQHKKLDVRFQAHVQLCLLRLHLAKKPGDASFSLANDISIPSDTLARALACETLARHHARLGQRDDVTRYLDLVRDSELRLHPYFFIGMALGEQDGK